MRHEKLSKTWALALASGALMLALSPSAFGGIYKSCRCNPSDDVFHSQFMGYYPTCWRPWPGGQPTCPKYPQVGEADSIPRAEPLPSMPKPAEKKPEGPIEKVPDTMPEKKPK